MWRTALPAALGVSSVLLGIALLLDVPTGSRIEALAGRPATLALVSVLLVSPYVLEAVSARMRPGSDRSERATSADGPTEAPDADPFDAPIETDGTLREAPDRPAGVVATGIADGGDRFEAATRLVADTAVAACAEATGSDRRTARDRIDRGGWTDDPVAAACLAGPEGPRYPPLSRLRVRVAPASERRRRIERTLAEIERRWDLDASPDT